jgi:NifU-like protein
MTPFYWERFSKKLKDKIDRPLFVGSFDFDLAKEKSMRLASANENKASLYLLVDEIDGVIADAKFQAYGPIALIGALEILCELVLRKTYVQASRITADLIDQHVRDKKDVAAFPKETFRVLNQVISLLDLALSQCSDIACDTTHDVTPIEIDFGEIPGGIAGWVDFSKETKIKIIEEVIDKEIRPYIELDAGGVNLIEFNDDKEVVIAYEGSCTSCHSSTGSTLTAIQNILKARVHPSLFVTPRI